MVRNQNIPFNANPYESEHARTDESANIYDSGLKNFLKCKPSLSFANGACWELLEFSTLRMVKIGQLGVRVSQRDYRLVAVVNLLSLTEKKVSAILSSFNFSSLYSAIAPKKNSKKAKKNSTTRSSFHTNFRV